jgi:hypothetical protein
MEDVVMDQRSVNPNNYKYCGQIQITHIKKCRDLHQKLLKKLNEHFPRFGRILKLKVLANGDSRLQCNQNTTVAFLQYVRNPSHWEAIDYFNNVLALYIHNKRVFFKPCGFTNEEFSIEDKDFNVHCQRFGQFGRPLNSSTWHDN